MTQMKASPQPLRILKGKPPVPRPRVDGRWECRKMVDGRSHSEIAATYDEALAKWNRWFYGPTEPPPASRDAYRTGSELEAVKPETMGELFDRWLVEEVEVKRARRTFETYRDIVRLHLKPTFGHVRLEDLRKPMVRPYLSRLEAENRPTTTIARIKGTFQAAIRWAIGNGWMSTSPLSGIDTPKPKARVKARETNDVEPQEKWIPSNEQVKAFLEANADDDLFALWFAGFTLGARPSELIMLKEDALVIGESGRLQYVNIFRKGFRTREPGRPWKIEKPKYAGVRRLPAPRVTLDVLKAQVNRSRDLEDSHPEWDAQWHGLLWRNQKGEPIDPTDLTTLFHTRCRRANWPFEVDAYTMRHYCLSAMWDADVPLKRIATWAGQRSTVNIVNTYGHRLTRAAGDNPEAATFEGFLGGFGSTLGSNAEDSPGDRRV